MTDLQWLAINLAIYNEPTGTDPPDWAFHLLALTFRQGNDCLLQPEISYDLLSMIVSLSGASCVSLRALSMFCCSSNHSAAVPVGSIYLGSVERGLLWKILLYLFFPTHTPSQSMLYLHPAGVFFSFSQLPSQGLFRPEKSKQPSVLI